ncbi:hypothetical protein GCM10017557_32870 [Streptomyces aurantiacus]|uniref:HTH cro/C1-type domain-containing protein n=1 Tax=Streptomyces aurantiacus TaxID=47760 RepID=A0A7G1NZ14_9ACTN|nr:hypothetical protein GCM10017557_32870 [Streptomyces aurantiacus]
MPRRPQPTARQARLGLELRKLREAAGLKAREAAALIGADSVQMSQIESGISGVSAQRLRRLACNYACADGELVDALVAMATDRARGWWEEYRGHLPTPFLNLPELEHHAKYRWDAEFLHIPGLLQTPDYARAHRRTRIAIRDSKTPTRGTLSFPVGVFIPFVEALKLADPVGHDHHSTTT